MSVVNGLPALQAAPADSGQFQCALLLAAATAERSGATTDPVVAGNTLYVVGAKGQLFAFR